MKTFFRFLPRFFLIFFIVLGLILPACKTKPLSPGEPAPVLERVQVIEEVETKVLEPVFTITSIAILQAELINTRFRVSLRINNPNPFPVELSEFRYELYGNGRLWADGIEKNAFEVPGNSTVEGNLFLLMNFIDMQRNLLDQIINLVDVNYRFAGSALVDTLLEQHPNFRTSFDLSGYSRVFER